MKNSALTIKNLSHIYDKNNDAKFILNSINLRIQKGELLGLLGPSGCGKTTLLRLIAGFEIPQKGEILLDDKLISSSSCLLSPEKRNIGMVFQDYALFPHLNVFDNAIFGLKNKNDFSRVNYLLNFLGIDNLKNRFPHELSGGQKQRLAIARALAPGTNFLLLDEPFCSLDLKVKLRLRSELPNILKNFNASGLLVTHDPEEAMAICDKVAVMNNGSIHQHDVPSKLVDHPKTVFVSSFIMDNNVLSAKFDNGYMKSIIGNQMLSNFSKKENMKYLSISPKSLFINKSVRGLAKVIAKEYLGEYYVYKVSIGKEEIRIRAEISNNLEINDRCNIGFQKNKEFFLFPGGYKNYIQ